MTDAFVPSDFEAPRGLSTSDFVMEPLGPEHNQADFAAWSSSIEHINATPGFDEPVDPDDPEPWPREMTPDENMGDLEMHARHFRDREGFTYTVLDPSDGDVIGCVYIYPPRDEAHDAQVQSWVRVSHAHLDVPLWRAVSEWLASDAWPFQRVRYAPRVEG
ncbi:MAG TPA: N-acetyltransferase [Actinomycetota bacterium]